MKRVLGILAVILLPGVSAVAECPVPPHTGPTTLTGWSIAQGGAGSSSKEESGVVRLGENSASQATKSFDCGSKGGHCNITFSVSAPTGATDQSMRIRFRYQVSGAWKDRSITYHRQPGAGHPVWVSLPACEQVEVEVSGDPGRKQRMESPFAAGPFYFECRDCKLKERGTKGN